MPALGSYGLSQLGMSTLLQAFQQQGITTYAMASLNTGYSARFQATDVRDIYSVWINWATVTAAGAVTLRIETSDTSTGKPSGNLYDANATKAFTPTVGWQQVTFSTPPSTGLTAGNEYHLVLLTTTGGTAHTLNAYNVLANLSEASPAIALTAADGTTRSNFAVVTASRPIGSIVFSDSSEECLALCPYAATTSFAVYGTRSAGMKFITTNALKISGVRIHKPTKNGSPDDFRVRILDSANALVTGASVTLPKVSIVTGRSVWAIFPAVVTLAAGTYRVLIDAPAHATSSGNEYVVLASTVRSTATMPGGATPNFVLTSTTDVTAGTPSWTNSTVDEAAIGLIVDAQVAISSGIVVVEDD